MHIPMSRVHYIARSFDFITSWIVSNPPAGGHPPGGDKLGVRSRVLKGARPPLQQHCGLQILHWKPDAVESRVPGRRGCGQCPL